jgi:hypothetical protein
MKPIRLARATALLTPVPQLIAFSAGQHPETPGQRACNRMSFTFTTPSRVTRSASSAGS